jgi:hypothetical protein
MNPFRHEPRRRFTAQERAKFFARAGGHCEKCTRKIPHADDWGLGEFDLDHEIALSRGGTNRDDNIRVLCSYCHDEKSADDASGAAKSKRIYTQHVVPSRHRRKSNWGWRR